MRLTRGAPWVTLVGAFASLTGLMQDARMHRLDPQLAMREGVFAMDHPAHRLFAAGLGFVVMGTLLFLTGESFRKSGTSMIRRAASAGMAVLLVVLSLATFTSAVAGGGHDHSGHSHAPTAPAATTPEYQAAASKLLKEVKASLARYPDLNAAAAAGYRQTTPYRFLRWGPAHFHNYAYNRDDGLLDPSRPESLVYFKLPNGKIVLIGAMFLARMGEGPRPGGPITQWHVHHNLCITATGSVALTNRQGQCPSGTFFVGAAVEMMHVWIFDHPDGPFGHEMTPEAIRAVLMQHGTK